VLLAGCAAAAGALTLLGTANAHVSLVPAQVPPETNQAFALRVPNEKAEPTVKLRVEFPDGITVSRFRPVPGWTRQVERDSQQRLVAVEWSGGQIADGEYQDFELIARTGRDAGKLAFNAYQTYQGGETVAWVNPEGQEQPAAILTVGGAPAPGTGGGSIEGAAGVQASSSTSAAATPIAAAAAPSGGQPTGGSASGQASGGDQSGGGSDLSLFTALGAAVIGIVALMVAFIALARRPKPA